MGGGGPSISKTVVNNFVTNPPVTGVCINYFFTGLTRALSLFPTEGLKKKEELCKSCI